MFPKSSIPAKPVSGYALLIPKAIVHQHSERSIRFVLIASFIFAILFAVTQPVAAQLNLNFSNNRTLKVSGNSDSLNRKYLYTNVATGYDCIVTVVDIQGGASLFSFDDNSLVNGGEIARFQPIITVPDIANNTSFIKFRFQLITSGSYNNSTNTGTNVIPTEPVWFRAYDVDGNGASGGVQEFVELNNVFTGSWVDNPSNLVAKTPITSGGDSYIISNATINGGAISDSGVYAFNGFIYANTVSSWDIIGGSVAGANPPNPNGDFNDADRLRSWSFIHEDAIPGIDFGDAPVSYSGVAPIIPAYHLVPSISANVKVYLGSIKPDADYDPSGNAAADVDDKNNAIDDEDGLSYTYFPKYTSNGDYKTTITATNTSGVNAYIYGYIDFNGDGDFADVNERSAMITVPSTASATLQTFTATFTAGFTYNATSTTRYARFRIATSATEAGNANGAATNGEVEDYRFNNVVTVKGKVWADADGMTDGDIDGTGIGNPGGSQVYAILINAAGKVVESAAVTTNGANTGEYTFNNAGQNNSFKVILSNTAGVIGSTPPAPLLPANWVNTGEGIQTAGDGTPNGSFDLSIANITTDITGLDFGIEQLPVGGSKTLTPIANPGGTNTYTIPANSFNPTDADGTVATIAIANFPANATSITINGTTYTSSTWPAGGVNSIAYNGGNPAINIDPIDGNTTVVINYTATDNAAKASANTGVLNIEFKVITVTGNVWNDSNGDAVKQAAENLYSTIGLNAILVDATGKVIQSVPVTAGAYTLTNVPYNTTGTKIIISTTAGIAGNVAPAITIPSGFVITGENNNGTIEIPGNATIILPLSTINLSTRNFGIEQPPVAASKTLAAVPNLGGFADYILPNNSFVPTDADGIVSTISITEFPTNTNAITIAGTTYTNGGNCPSGLDCSPWPAGGITGIAYNSGMPDVSIDPVDGGVTVDIKYTATDNAGKTSGSTGFVKIPFSVISVSGNVWNDVNGNAVKDGTESLYLTSGLNALLLDVNGKVVQSVPVVSGAYTLTNFPPNTTGYKIIISNTAGTSGNSIATATVAAGFIITGQNNNGTVENNGTGIITLPSSAVSLTNRNFGIEQPPVTFNKTLANVGNPGGTTNYTIPTGNFVPTDADGSIAFINIILFPTNTTSVTIGGVNYTSNTWPSGGVSNIPFNGGMPDVKIDPVDGNTTVDISYKAVDNAGKISGNTSVLSIPFTSITLSGNVWNDTNGNVAKEAAEPFYTAGNLKAVLVDANNKIVQAVTISNTGAYTITDLPYNVTGYKVLLSTAAITTVGTDLLSNTLPNNYILTGKNNNGTIEVPADGKITLPSTSTALTSRNFGIERLPETVNRTKTFAYVTPGYGNPLTDVALQGSDPEDSSPAGSISDGGKFIITELPPASQAIITYNSVDITSPNFVITNYNPSLLGIRHTSLATTTSFKYATIDAAGKQDPTPATYTVNLASLLPLNGLNLSANQQSNTIRLTWDVTGERNVVRYELEYSTNNTTFSPLTSVNYHTSANGTNTYTYTHLPAVSNGVIFYHVIQYRADGTSTISNQVSVRLDDRNTPFVTVMPSLITDMTSLRIHSAKAGKAVINVVDNNGRVLNKKELYLPVGITTFTMDGWLPLPGGTYFIQVNSADLKTVKKVIVQH